MRVSNLVKQHLAECWTPHTVEHPAIATEGYRRNVIPGESRFTMREKLIEDLIAENFMDGPLGRPAVARHWGVQVAAAPASGNAARRRASCIVAAGSLERLRQGAGGPAVRAA